jgi:hypothetical protein
MKCSFVVAMAGAVALLALSGPAPAAADGSKSRSYSAGKGTKVYGYARRGGYSYSYADSINTYGDSRSLYGATQHFRDPMLDRQTNAGPFDHGFFFESGVAPRGGNSPYMN